MRRIVLLLGFAGLVFAGCTDTGGDSKPIESSSDNGGGVSVEEVDDTTSSGEPEGNYRIASCDADIGTGGGYNYKLFGSVRVTNTGDVPIDANITFKWLLGDGGNVEATQKRIKNLEGSKLVFFTEIVSQDVGSLFQEHPRYMASRNCRANAEIS